MNQKLALAVAMAAGFVGGILSQYLSPVLVHAQAQAPKEMRAQNFVLVNEQGVAYGLFGFNPEGEPVMKIIDERGRTVWSAPPEPLVGTPRRQRPFLREPQPLPQPRVQPQPLLPLPRPPRP